MAIVRLSNGSQWDTNGDPGMQSSGSQDFWVEVQETNTPIQTTEQTRNTNRNRILKEVYTDTSYTGSNYVVIVNNNFMHGSGDIRCFALQGSNIEYSIESK